MTIEQLSWFVDDTVTKQMLSIEGMAEVNRFGGVSREIEVRLDPVKMQALGVTAGQINSVLRQSNLDAGGGMAEVGGTRQSVRILGNNASAYDLGQTQIQLGGGRTVRLSDVATVRDGFGERTQIAKLDKREVVNFSMARAKGASDVTVYEEALVKIKQIEAENPGVHFIQLFDTVRTPRISIKAQFRRWSKGQFWPWSWSFSSCGTGGRPLFLQWPSRYLPFRPFGSWICWAST